MFPAFLIVSGNLMKERRPLTIIMITAAMLGAMTGTYLGRPVETVRQIKEECVPEFIKEDFLKLGHDACTEEGWNRFLRGAKAGELNRGAVK